MKLTKPQPVHPATGTSSPIPQPNHQSVLLLVDLQNDFFPGGALGVQDAHSLLPLINAYIRLFSTQGLTIMATRDWHPSTHCSFQEHGGSWPAHCVQGSKGAQFHSQLVMPPGTMVISKGTLAHKDAYSGFDGTSLEDRLEDAGVHTLFVLGLATDYCVKLTVLDARARTYQVVILEDATRGVNRHPQDSTKALEEMAAAGAIRARAEDLGIHPNWLQGRV